MASGACYPKCTQAVGILLLLMCCSFQFAHARRGPNFIPSFLEAPYKLLTSRTHQKFPTAPSVKRAEPEAVVQRAVEAEFVPAIDNRGEKFEVPTPALILPYHNGPLLSASSGIPVYIIWYGTFSAAQKSIVTDFFASFSSGAAHPSVSSWWSITAGYKDASGNAVSPNVKLGGQTSVSYTLGTTLTDADVETLVVGSLATFPTDASGLYLVLTASDVMVGDFCLNSCGSHFATVPGASTNGKQLPYAWVGNPSGSASCEGLCAWPYAKAAYGPPDAPLVAPNGDVGIDGMMINIGIILAGVATDPYTNGYYQGDASAPLESGSACEGIYGAGAYSGYPGALQVDPATKASYNVNGANGRKYLMSALWDPSALACTPPS